MALHKAMPLMLPKFQVFRGQNSGRAILWKPPQMTQRRPGRFVEPDAARFDLGFRNNKYVVLPTLRDL